MRVLVTGGAGFIGSHVVRRLLLHGADVVVLDNLSSGSPENLPSDPSLRFLKGDVLHERDLEDALHGCDSVVHLAAQPSVQASLEDPIGTHEVNYVSTLKLLRAMERKHVDRIVFASSAAVYGDARVVPISEEACVQPLSPYGIDKAAGEMLLSAQARLLPGLKATSLRFFNVYGERQDPRSPYSGVISRFVDCCLNAAPITVFGDGEQSRDFVYAGDVADVVVMALQGQLDGQAIYNVGTGHGRSLNELLGSLERVSGRKLSVLHADAKPGDIRHSCADNARLMQAIRPFAWTPLEQGLDALVRWRRSAYVA